MMDERDYYWLSAAVFILALCGAVDSYRINRLRQREAALTADVDWLKDHTVSTETEARP
jgi:hypothetical protein